MTAWQIAALILAPLAATRWATLVTRDDFGPIRQLREWAVGLEARHPTATTQYRTDFLVSTADGAGVTPSGVQVVQDATDPDLWWPIQPSRIGASVEAVGSLVSCVRCVSVWTSTLAVVLFVFLPAPAVVAVFAPFAWSQVAIGLTGADR